MRELDQAVSRVGAVSNGGGPALAAAPFILRGSLARQLTMTESENG
jgi:hypothetical protein